MNISLKLLLYTETHTYVFTYLLYLGVKTYGEICLQKWTIEYNAYTACIRINVNKRKCNKICDKA